MVLSMSTMMTAVSEKKSPPNPDANLVAKAKRGDLTAFNQLVLIHQKQMFNIAYRMMGDQSLAADMTQDAFIKAHKSIKSLKGDNFKAWVARIVSNRCLDELRKQKRRGEESIEAVTDGFESPRFLASETDNPESVQVEKDRFVVIKRCLEGLPPDQRNAIILRDVQGYDYASISETLELSLGTVKSRISRARASLRSCLRELVEEQNG